MRNTGYIYDELFNHPSWLQEEAWHWGFDDIDEFAFAIIDNTPEQQSPNAKDVLTKFARDKLTGRLPMDEERKGEYKSLLEDFEKDIEYGKV